MQRCGLTCSGRPTCTCRGHMWLQMIILAKPARWPSQASGRLHTASPSAPLKEHLPEAISNPAARSRHPPPAAVSSCKPLSNTPLTGAFTTPPVLELGGQTTPPGRCRARHTSSMAHSSIPAHFPRARASLQPMLCPSSTIIGAMCCTAHGSC